LNCFADSHWQGLEGAHDILRNGAVRSDDALMNNLHLSRRNKNNKDNNPMVQVPAISRAFTFSIDRCLKATVITILCGSC